MPRRSVLVAFVILVAVLASPASAASPNDPFVGAWESLGAEGIEGPVRMQIGGGGHYHLFGRGSLECGDGVGFARTGLGTTERIAETAVRVTANFYCHVRGGRILDLENAQFPIVYHEPTDTLQSGVCWYRAGSDPSACE